MSGIDFGDFGDLFVPSARGKRGTPLDITVTRELNDADVQVMAAGANVGAVISPVQRMRERHHHVARLLVDGLTGAEVSVITGMSQSRISILKNDPAFQDLLAYYSGQKAQVYIDVHQRLAGLGMDAVETLRERLEEEPEKFTNRELMEVAEMALDRSVAPKMGSSGVPAGTPGGASPVTLNITFRAPEGRPDDGPDGVIDLEPVR